MKSAIIKSICILLVELPEGDILFENHYLEVINKDSLQTAIIVFNRDSIGSYPIILGENLSLENNYTYIAPFSEMTEERFEPLVELHGKCQMTYKNYGKKPWHVFSTARESFISAVESEGLRIGMMEHKPVYNGNGDDESISDFDFESIKWYTAQSKTFNPLLTHLFKLETK